MIATGSLRSQALFAESSPGLHQVFTKTQDPHLALTQLSQGGEQEKGKKMAENKKKFEEQIDRRRKMPRTKKKKPAENQQENQTQQRSQTHRTK